MCALIFLTVYIDEAPNKGTGILPTHMQNQPRPLRDLKKTVKAIEEKSKHKEHI